MLQYIIKGGRRLEGEVKISGSKNASLPIIAATILNKGTTTLYNVPEIHDTKMMFEILKELGGSVTKKVSKNKGKTIKKYIIDTREINSYEIHENLMNQMRSSVIYAGALIGRFKKVTFTYPGGCDIGARPIDLHLKNFEKLGINITKNYGNIICSCDKIKGENVDLDFPSVGATENIILAACLGEGTTIIKNAAMEPEILDLQKILNKMGANIKGAGTNKIVIQGVNELKKHITYKIMPDRIETGTFLCATAVTNGHVLIKNTNPSEISPVVSKLEETGCIIESKNNQIEIKAPRKLKAVDIKTMPYPGFPTDMQSIFVATLAVAKGDSIAVENIFENRYKCVNQLNKMGAKIKIEGKIAAVKGVRKLYGTTVNAEDLRGGAALVVAGLNAKNQTVINNIEYILRGYEYLDKKLKNLGAEIYLNKT